jgi:hypothetical protein
MSESISSHLVELSCAIVDLTFPCSIVWLELEMDSQKLTPRFELLLRYRWHQRPYYDTGMADTMLDYNKSILEKRPALPLDFLFAFCWIHLFVTYS